MSNDPNPAETILRWFEHDHLPAGPVRTMSAHHARLAEYIVTVLPRSAERTVALRKLLEAKDAAVRCAVALERQQDGAERVAERAVVDEMPTLSTSQRCRVVIEGVRCELPAGHASWHRGDDATRS